MNITDVKYLKIARIVAIVLLAFFALCVLYVMTLMKQQILRDSVRINNVEVQMDRKLKALEVTPVATPTVKLKK